MKKFLFLSILAGLCLTGCTNDELVKGNDGQLSKSDYINFTFQQDNMTRADQKLSNTHYEFGVFADNGETVMSNYLVGWGGENSLYKERLEGVTTYGDPTSQVDGLSYWFYEKLSPDNHTDYTTAEQAQVLKFWDKSKANYYFWAYAPYTTAKADPATGLPAKNADKVTFTKTNNEFTFANLSSFYTSPVESYQVGTADVDAANDLGSSDVSKYNAEMINYNEGLYAYSTKAKAAYGTDVPFNFNHINAKINLAFYEDIEGYKVQLMDMIPAPIQFKNSSEGNVGDPIAVQNGIVLTPATPAQAVYYDQTTKEYKQQAASAALAKYYAQTKVDVSGINGTATIAVGDKAVNDSVNTNLYFQPTNATGTLVNGETLYIGETQANATPSATQLYVLPNYAGTQYITPLMTEGADYVASNTGYTLHVSYMLIPEDGTAKAMMYDARVYIAPEYCRWQAGKAYKYIFKITLNANGTTDPVHEFDDAETDPTPYVDPTDPRVPDQGGLLPIVFDGIMVSDYEDVTVNPEFIITESDLETSFQKALASIKAIFSTGGTSLPLTATGNGSDDTTNAFNVNYTVKVGDFKWPSWSTEHPWQIDPMPADINDNNVFKDIQALSQAMYNQEGIKKIVYNGVTYEKDTDNSLNPPSWYPTSGTPVKPGESLESNIAATVFGGLLEAGTGAVVPTTDDVIVKFELMDANTPANTSYVHLNLKVIAD